MIAPSTFGKALKDVGQETWVYARSVICHADLNVICFLMAGQGDIRFRVSNGV